MRSFVKIMNSLAPRLTATPRQIMNQATRSFSTESQDKCSAENFMKMTREITNKDINIINKDISVLNKDIGMIREDLHGVKGDIKEMKADTRNLIHDTVDIKVLPINHDISTIKSDLHSLKSEIKDTSNNINQIHEQINGLYKQGAHNIKIILSGFFLIGGAAVATNQYLDNEKTKLQPSGPR